jgi:hypothetical protein
MGTEARREGQEVVSNSEMGRGDRIDLNGLIKIL